MDRSRFPAQNRAAQHYFAGSHEFSLKTCPYLGYITLHHPLDYYFALFLRAKKTEGFKPRTLSDHESHYRYLQRWLAKKYPTLKLEELTADHIRQYVGYMLTEQTLYDEHPTLQAHNTRYEFISYFSNKVPNLKYYLDTHSSMSYYTDAGVIL